MLRETCCFIYLFVFLIVGVESVAIAGGDKDHLVVVGESIDPVKLVRNLRKKVGHADIISMNKVNSDSDEDEDDDESGRKQIVEYMPRLWYPNNYSPYIMYR